MSPLTLRKVNLLYFSRKNPAVSILVLLIIGGFVVFLARSYVGYASWELAQHLVANGKPAEDCYLLVDFDIGPRPMWIEQRESCVRDYASITRDPTACQLLMPGEYGLSCINNVVSQEFKDDPEASWVEEKDCPNVTGPSLKYDNCIDTMAHRSHDPRDCDAINNTVMRAGCRLKMEAWHKFPELRTSLQFGKYRDK